MQGKPQKQQNFFARKIGNLHENGPKCETFLKHGIDENTITS
jgi:hypothetical protein